MLIFCFEIYQYSFFFLILSCYFCILTFYLQHYLKHDKQSITHKLGGKKTMRNKKLQSIKESNPEQIIKIARDLLDINIDDLTENQKLILRDQYLANLRHGLKPKEAMEKALKVVFCFN